MGSAKSEAPLQLPFSPSAALADGSLGRSALPTLDPPQAARSVRAVDKPVKSRLRMVVTLERGIGRRPEKSDNTRLQPRKPRRGKSPALPVATAVPEPFFACS